VANAPALVNATTSAGFSGVAIAQAHTAMDAVADFPRAAAVIGTARKDGAA